MSCSRTRNISSGWPVSSVSVAVSSTESATSSVAGVMSEAVLESLSEPLQAVASRANDNNAISKRRNMPAEVVMEPGE